MPKSPPPPQVSSHPGGAERPEHGEKSQQQRGEENKDRKFVASNREAEILLLCIHGRRRKLERSGSESRPESKQVAGWIAGIGKKRRNRNRNESFRVGDGTPDGDTGIPPRHGRLRRLDLVGDFVLGERVGAGEHRGGGGRGRSTVAGGPERAAGPR